MTSIINIVVATWQMVMFMWKYVKPIYRDVLGIIEEAKAVGLKDENARRTVFQRATDCIQERGLEEVPDSVLNCAIEMIYQMYLWKKGVAK